jgi:hypothetical protein
MKNRSRVGIQYLYNRLLYHSNIGIGVRFYMIQLALVKIAAFIKPVQNINFSGSQQTTRPLSMLKAGKITQHEIQRIRGECIDRYFA